MSTLLRSVIEAGLRVMEPGRFQDFCLAFLPILDHRFKGLTRFGHTAEGKTRPGTPDLIKTDASGHQTAVQCGTEEDYWKEKDELQNWKPVKDARKCIEALDYMTELVLTSNREIPTGAPNTKRRIQEVLATETSAIVTLLAREDISQTLTNTSHEPGTQTLLQEFLPQAYSFLQNEAEAQKFRVARTVASQVQVRADALFSLLDRSALEPAAITQDASQYVLHQIHLLHSYRIYNLPAFQGIVREKVSHLPIANPFGKVWSVTGIPKIGKTSLALQLAHYWFGCDVRWYDCTSEDPCAYAIAEDIIGLFISDRDALASLLRSDLALSNAIKHAQDISMPTVYIIDNVNNLTDSGLRLIQRVISYVKRCLSSPRIAIVFLSNKRIPDLSPIVDHDITAPAWDAEELGRLLLFYGVVYEPSSPTGYLTVLQTVSGGHPVVALSLARRYPTTQDLLRNRLSSSPEPADETLSREVQVFLYSELLVDADSQNFVQRLSVVPHGATQEILEVIRLNVNPQIQHTSAVLLNRLSGVVIEGDEQVGYKIPAVFREVASKHITEEERRSVHRAVYKTLLTFSETTIYADRTIDGAFYAILAGDLKVAHFWVTFLLRIAYQRSLPKPLLRVILVNLHWVRLLSRPPGLIDSIGHALMLAILSTSYVHIDDYASAYEVLDNAWIDLDRTDQIDPAQQRLCRQLRCMVAVHRAVTALFLGRANALQELYRLDSADLRQAEPHELRPLYEVLFTAILRAKFDEISSIAILQFLSIVEQHASLAVDLAFKVAASLGSSAKLAGKAINNVDAFFPNTSLGYVLCLVSRASFSVDNDQPNDSLDYIEAAIAKAQQLEVAHGQALAIMEQVKGDAQYKVKNTALAQESYSTVLRHASSGSFEEGWSSWRLGLITHNEAFLSSASNAFRAVGNISYSSRALGARSAALVIAGRYQDALACFHELIDSYYNKADAATAPAVAVCLSNLSRLRLQLEGLPDQDTLARHPEITPDLYETVLESTSPRAGPIGAHYWLAELYYLIGEPAAAREIMVQAISHDPSHPEDYNVVPILVKDCLSRFFELDRDADHIRRCCALLIANWKSVDWRSKTFASFCIFSILDSPQSDLSRTESLTSIVDRVLLECSVDDPFWRAEVRIRRAKLAKAAENDESATLAFYQEALLLSEAGGNATVTLHATHTLGFELYERSSGILELAKYHLKNLHAIELLGCQDDQLRTLGRNLLALWGGLTYRRLRDVDLSAKRHLLDCAHRIRQAEVPPDLASLTMLLLLGKTFAHTSACLEKIKDLIRPQISALPHEVSELLRTD